MAQRILPTLLSTSVLTSTSLITGIPYNPQGQGIVERAHATLKNYLQKIKKGEYGTMAYSPQKWLSHALFILNFLILDNQGKTAADRHWHPETKRQQVYVKWKDPLTAQWYGPDPVLIWGRGHVSIFSMVT